MPLQDDYHHEYYIKHRERILKRMNEYNSLHKIQRKEYDKNHYLLKKDKSSSGKIKIEQGIKISFN